MAALPPPMIRRPISLTVVTLTLLIAVGLSLIVIPVLLVADLVTRTPLRRSRMWCLIVGVLAVEFTAAIAGIVMIAWHAGRVDGDAAQRRLHRLEQWWAARHAGNFRRFAGLRWLVENPDELEHADAIVVSRHASHADALLPLILFGNLGGHRLLYTLKEELQWAPAMDIVGNRLPNVFVDRTPGPDSPLEDRIEALAGRVDPDHVAVIFPEGTFFTPERLDRAAVRIAETRPDLEAAARSLRHLLPPRPAGTFSLLRGAPTADLVLVAHVGMEAFGDLAAIRANLPLHEPVRVRLWRIPRHDIPTAEDDFTTWLLDRWIEVDRWIETRTGEQRDRLSGATPDFPKAEAGP
jgi:1-acyl-sn-glycerol-3-phosphate acyltransferase